MSLNLFLLFQFQILFYGLVLKQKKNKIIVFSNLLKPRKQLQMIFITRSMSIQCCINFISLLIILLQFKMSFFKQFFLEMDLFTHTSLDAYRTVTGGILSLLIVGLFVGLFSTMTIDTFSNNIIISSTSITYDSDPSLSDMTTSVSNSFMFAVGIVGLDLSKATQRYFDIVFQAISVVNGTKKTTKAALTPCQLSQWSGVTDDISASYNIQNFGQWLCPPDGFSFPLQGKRTSTAFKYARIMVSKCGTKINSTGCVSQTVVNDFISTNDGITLNYYYINPNINPGESSYLNYYLEDFNYFTFDTKTGVSANIFYADFDIKTDRAILPYNDYATDNGLITLATANMQTYSVSSKDQYAKLYIRKASQKQSTQRSYQKLDQTLSYIGGLLGTVILLLCFMSVYSKFCFEIQFGDRMFKKNHDGSYGSQNFNFIVYLGYGFFNVMNMFGVTLNWDIMKKYHQCRTQTSKQLDIELLLKKLDYFEEVSRILLDDHHINGIYMLPKRKFSEVRKNRKRFLLQNLIYYNLDRKANEVYVEDIQYQKRNQKFLKEKKKGVVGEILREKQQYQQQNEYINKMQMQCVQSFKKLSEQSRKGCKFSKKIIDTMHLANIVSAIMRMSTKGPGPKIDNEKDNHPSSSNFIDKSDNLPPSSATPLQDILRRDIGPRSMPTQYQGSNE